MGRDFRLETRPEPENASLNQAESEFVLRPNKQAQKSLKFTVANLL